MKIAVLDTETYFDSEYSLKKMTTEAYVRDPRFKLHCVGIKAMDKLPALNAVAQPTMTMNHDSFFAMRERVPEYAVVMHKAQFDGLILSHHYGVQPAFYFDTLSMSRLVFPHEKSHSLEAMAKKFNLMPKIVPYDEFRGVRDLGPELYNKVAGGCAHDIELTYLVFRYLLPLVPREELKIIDMTIRMFTQPRLRLDRPRMEAYYEKVKADKIAVLDQLGVTKADLQSSAKFAELLVNLGVEPPTKPSPKHPEKRIFAFSKTDEAMKALLDDEDDRVAALCAARLGQKSTQNETRSLRLLEMDVRGWLCVFLNTFGAHTLRWSGGDKMNWQNFQRGGEIRKCIMAPEGYVLVIGDESQIECRMLNWLAGEQWVLEAFRQHRDLYSEIATKFYQRPIDKSTLLERGMGKQIELSCGFGSGGPKIVITAKRGTYGPPVTLTQEEGMAARDLYRSTHTKVVDLWKIGNTMLTHLFNGTEIKWGPMLVKDHKVYMPNGAFLDYSNLIFEGTDKYGRSEFSMLGRKGKVRIYGPKFIQNIIEALSREVLVKTMICMQDAGIPVVTCTHDEVVGLVPAQYGQQALDFVLSSLKTPPDWCRDIPLDAEGAFDVRYSK